ncbi:MAG: twin transmembrane helix small protein [Burkholderiales bacterium]|nr:MAG: twin transmembrane helix small protein [Betaproteobacteria bacterium]TAG67455.1 MAG: twin transmembrane helix small protein [Burkholderiales bacterium]
MRWLVILCLVAIVVSMASALYFMYRDGSNEGAGGNRMFRALALRVGLSVGLFVFLMVAYKLGYIGSGGVGR